MNTRVYQYGAIPTSPYPEEAIQELKRSNELWNKLVELHNANYKRWTEARCQADTEYEVLHEQLEKLNDRIDEAYQRKRQARQQAGTRDESHPLIQPVLNEIEQLKKQRRRMYDEQVKPARKRVDAKINKKALNDAFKVACNQAAQVRNCGLDSVTANEVKRNFKQARDRVFKQPNSRLRFHRFDGTGYRHYRFREQDSLHDGVTVSRLFQPGRLGRDRPFVLEKDAGRPLGERASRRGGARWKLRAKVAGGSTRASSVYAEFDMVVHRPMPNGAQINNAKLMRHRVGDRFRYTVSFSVRVPDVARQHPGTGAIGVDIGFRRLPDGTMRAATVVVLNGDAGLPPEHVVLEEAYIDGWEHIKERQSTLDKSATDLGERIKSHLKAGAVLPEDHKKYKLVRGVATMPANRTMSYEQAYKMAEWFIRKEPHTLPNAAQTALREWWKVYRRRYREIHNLRAKLLGRRRDHYRNIAARLVRHRLPIGVEEIKLNRFAEVRDEENVLSNTARHQRFLVSPSEFLGAIRNAVEREGDKVHEIPARNTSRRCSACRRVNRALGSEIEWECSSCHVTHDRDENAAKNIANAVQKEVSRGEKQAVEA